MQKGFKIAAVAGALSIALSGSAFAANTIGLNFNGVGVNGGIINYSGTGSVCANTDQWSCTVVTGGDSANKGFVQIEVDPTSNNTANNTPYIMTIITDPTATATNVTDASTYSSGPGGVTNAFYDMNFVPMSGTNTTNGIMGQQGINQINTDSTTGDVTKSFDATTNLNTGWAVINNTPLKLSQHVNDKGDLSNAFDNFTSGFTYETAGASGDSPTGFAMAIDQTTGLYTVGQAMPVSGTDIASFAYREAQGDKLAGGGPLTLTDSSGVDHTLAAWTGGCTPAVGGCSNDTADVKSIWLGQNIDFTGQDIPASNAPPGTTTGTVGLGNTFGYLSFDNVAPSDTAAPISQFGFGASESTAPVTWDTAFNINGTGTPCLADPTGAIPGACQ